MYGDLYPVGNPWDIYKQDDPDLVNRTLALAATQPQPPAVAPVALPNSSPLSPLPRESGLSAQNTVSNEGKALSGQTSNIYYTPEEYAGLTNLVRSTPEYQAEELSQKRNQDLFNQQLTRKAPLDLANPLANLSDYVQTGRLGMRPVGEDQEKAQNRIREWAKQIQDDQRDLARVLQQGVANLKSGAVTQQNYDLLKQIAVQGANAPQFNPNTHSNAEVNNYGKFTKQAQGMLAKDQEAAKEAEQLKSAINGSPTAQREVPIMLTKLLTGASRVPVQEALMAKGDPAATARFMQSWNTLANGTIDESNKAQYLSFIDSLLALHNQGLQAHVAQAKVLGAGYGVAPEKVNAFLAPQFVNPYSQKTKTAPQMSDIQSAAQAELARRKKAQGQ